MRPGKILGGSCVWFGRWPCTCVLALLPSFHCAPLSLTGRVHVHCSVLAVACAHPVSVPLDAPTTLTLSLVSPNALHVPDAAPGALYQLRFSYPAWHRLAIEARCGEGVAVPERASSRHLLDTEIFIVPGPSGAYGLDCVVTIASVSTTVAPLASVVVVVRVSPLRLWLPLPADLLRFLCVALPLLLLACIAFPNFLKRVRAIA